MKRELLLLLLALTAAGAPHKVVRNTPTLEFSYQWPAEAVALPALDLWFYNDAKRNLAEAQKDAADDRRLGSKVSPPYFRKHEVSEQWTTAGTSPRLLSFVADLGWDTGGAHPNRGTKALLWDRALGRAVSVGALFASASEFATLTRSLYCKKLDAERAKRREGEGPSLLGSDDPFDKCPKSSELAVYPTDKNRNGRFDRIVFTASPYVAGPYVEGEYEITLPVTPQLIAALKPEYRASFEPQRQ
jgi:hypothetical protein